jgi:outer membrane protein TolC
MLPITLLFCALSQAAIQSPATYAVTPPIRMTFADAVDQALRRNPSAQIAQQEITRAMGLLEQTRAASLPVLNGVAGLVLLDHARGSTLVSTGGKEQQNANIILSVPLVNPRAWGNWAEARTATEVSAAADANVRRQVAIAVARAYLAVITQTNIVAVEQTAVETDRKHFDYAHSRYAGGVGNRLDELRADQEVANSEVQLHQALSAQAQAREALGVLVGFSGPVDVADDMPMETAGEQAASLALSETLRADVLMAKKQLLQAEQIRRHTWLDFSPSIIGTANYFFSNPPTVSLPSHGWALTAFLSVPFYDGGARYGLKTQREAALHQARVSLENTERVAHSEVRLTYEIVVHAEAALNSARRGAQQAQEALELANRAYHAGTTGNLEVIDAERVNRDAQTAAIVAEDAMRKARLDLVTAIGKFPS